MRRLDLVAAVAIGAMGVLAPAAARAHFILMAPPNWANQAAGTGTPLKSAPCGQADPGMTAVRTNAVTPFTAGQTITVTIDERTISHPGHYRVALSTTGMSGLPADPPVTAGGQPSSACGSTVIQNPPVYPVLADGMLVHTTAPTSIQSFTVKLPDNMTCSGTDNCVLQVIEFMSNHALNNPGGCFYHHCAYISIAAATTGTGGAGGAAGAAGGGGRGGAAGGGAGGRGGAAGGSAGTGGSAGVAGAAGSGAAGNGAAGTGGAGTGVAGSGAAGTTGAAGAVAGSGGTTGVSGSGGSGTGTAGDGSGGSPTGAAGSGMTPADDGGCACGLTGTGAGSGSLTLLLLASLATFYRSRRRS